MRRRAKHQEEMQDEYVKAKNKLKNMDIELHTEVCSDSEMLGLLPNKLTVTLLCACSS